MGSRLGILCCALIAAGFGLVFATSPASAACDPAKALVSDDFEDFLDPSWGDADQYVELADGVLLMKIPSGRLNLSSKSDLANVCVDAAIKTAKDEKTTWVGLMFWFQDANNYYFVQVWDYGYAQVARVLNGKSFAVFAAEVPDLKKGLGQANNIELRLGAKDATLVINGAVVKRFKGVPPKGGSWIGVMGGAPENDPATFTFDNFVVTNESP